MEEKCSDRDHAERRETNEGVKGVVALGDEHTGEKKGKGGHRDVVAQKKKQGNGHNKDEHSHDLRL